jgi:colanic acid/amylovoran biosynthesis glycosyltransferase
VRIAYLTSTYPSVSHTFIRRELVELERQVGEIARFAIRHSPYKIVDEDDAREDGKTFRLLSQSKLQFAKVVAKRLLTHPRATLDGLRKAIDLGRKSQRGLPVHGAYFIEAMLLVDELQRRGIEHVHVHFGTNPAAVAQISRAMGGPPYSFTVHGPDELDAPLGLKLGSKIEDSAFVVAITNYCGAQLRRWVSHEHWDKIRVVHCTVGDEFFSESKPVDPRSKSLVCVGRLSPQKGQILLVEAFADAIDRGVDAQLVLAGDGEMRGEIERVAAARKLGDRLRITGWISGAQVREEILAARAMVLPSFAEGLPMVIMEAFALGRPVLTTYIAGIPELVVHKENGWLMPAGDASAITEAIIEIMRTPTEQLERMAAAGRDAVRKHHYTPTETARLAEHVRASIATEQLRGGPS